MGRKRGGAARQARWEQYKPLLCDRYDSIRQAIAGAGGQLTAYNDYGHWRFVFSRQRRIFEWWPQSGRFVVDQRYHAAEIYPVMEIVICRIMREVGQHDFAERLEQCVKRTYGDWLEGIPR